MQGFTKTIPWKAIFCLFSALLLSASFTDDAWAYKQVKHGKSTHKATYKSRHASLVMDANTGAILSKENAYEARYPASLTKMMTLYLLFDALQQQKITLRTMFTASKKAASQPQTNIALEAGEKIPVELAIKSLVVHSANDVALMIGENLAGSEANFAAQMTAKAKALGMKNTVFRNPSGLPNPAQHTTAYDMAVLGKALRDNFPNYFPYFKTTSFVYNGRTFRGHNRVLGRFEGADGIKTGFIRASGFNLVTSAKRGNHSVIAVVMGGSTWKERDDEMVRILTGTFAALESGRPVPSFARKTAPIENERKTAKNPSISTERPTIIHQEIPQIKNKTIAQNKNIAKDKNWGVQVGAYRNQKEAMRAASRAIQIANKETKDAYISVSKPTSGKILRARVGNLSKQEAKNICRKLNALKQSCITVAMN